MKIPKQLPSSITVKDQLSCGNNASATKESNTMKIPDTIVPKTQTFDLPEGTFRAKIHNFKSSVRQTGTGPKNWIRILFEVAVPTISKKMCLAGRNFELNLHPGSDLRNFLTSLLGEEFFEQLSGESFPFESLIGRDCEIDLIHQSSDKFHKPYVFVTSIRQLEGVSL